jgi:CheY-like chemotaxis protein
MRLGLETRLFRMLDDKLSILYYDDQKEFREGFIERHRGRFAIETADDISEVLEELERRSRLPDLLLLDLYHDIDRSDTAQAQRIAEAKTALEELNGMLQRVKLKVDSAWQPAALKTLRRVRDRFSVSELPIMVYSQRGLFFLDEGQMNQVEDAQAHWMLKDKGEHYEAERVRCIVEQRPRRRPARDITIAIASVVAGAAISQAIQLVG